MLNNEPGNRPNILWISMEDTSPRFGCYGDMVARTPNIDRLAAEGCIFKNAFSTAGVCSPSRRAIITGMYQTSVGSPHHRTTSVHKIMGDAIIPYEAVLPPYVKVFSEYLRAAGYYCTNNSKTDYQFNAPFTAWDENGNQAHWRNRKPGQPFFAVFNPSHTHESGMWPEKAAPEVTDSANVTLPPYLPDTPVTRETLARHYDQLIVSDGKIGEILGQLDEDGLADNTVVILWSDHGEGMPRGKRWLYDSGIRIPLIVRWPGQLAPGTVTDQVVNLVDLAPTVLALTGVTIPSHMQGKVFLGPKKKEREYAFAARDRHDEMYDMVRAVRDKRYKYIRNYYPELPYLLHNQYRNRHPVMQEMWRLHALNQLEGTQAAMFKESRPAEELYDCQEDPHEIRNLADDPAYGDILERLRGKLDDWRQTNGDQGDIPEHELIERMWPGKVQPTTAPPQFIPVGASEPGLQRVNQGTYAEPVLIQIYSGTQGASIGYTTESGEDASWQLYTKPLRLSQGTTTLRAKAIRIGFKPSEEREAVFTLN
ncbi:MAG: sulfatase [Paenibacillaceae bacterium]|nr:sulfatase [Paenibacillaceae bacterium]